ncbi:hepatic leukemia factor-like [Notolabrus celidotus]|uniref:hepatic leukemia factor-like n=1 Tax=Notolabrus celidotus TaxID=1203425 RepID=UPI00148FE431|nr:hepatic leukemia factor-like [Notolabrus celidotus]
MMTSERSNRRTVLNAAPPVPDFTDGGVKEFIQTIMGPHGINRAIQRLEFCDCKKGLGVKIIGGYRELTGEEFGIYIKRVIVGGLAALDGRLKSGDLILDVNNISLIGVTNERSHQRFPLFPSGLPSSRNTPSPPIDPDSIHVPVGYEPDPADLALSSVPGQEMFDPRKRKFSAEELKPQPMIKKARKVFIPEDLKDDKYWARRRKNNMAAKRSRDARRLKENQIAIRANFLEKENSALRHEVADLRKELGRTKNVLAKYESRHGPL